MFVESVERNPRSRGRRYPSPNPLLQGERRGICLRQGYRTTRRCDKMARTYFARTRGSESLPRHSLRTKGAYIRFCETNPPFFGEFSDVTSYPYGSCDTNCRNNSVGSFWKTNPKIGVLRGVIAPKTEKRPQFEPSLRPISSRWRWVRGLRGSTLRRVGWL